MCYFMPCPIVTIELSRTVPSYFKGGVGGWGGGDCKVTGVCWELFKENSLLVVSVVVGLNHSDRTLVNHWMDNTDET